MPLFVPKVEIIPHTGWNKKPGEIRPNAGKPKSQKKRKSGLDLGSVSKAIVTPKAGPSTNNKSSQQGLLTDLWQGSNETPTNASKRPKSSSVPAKRKAAAAFTGEDKPHNIPRRPTREGYVRGTVVGWNSDEESDREVELKKAAKRLKTDGSVLPFVRSPLRGASLSAHEQAFGPGLRRSASPAPVKMPDAVSMEEQLEPNPYEGEVFSQMPYEQETCVITDWARDMDMETQVFRPRPPRSSPPKYRLPSPVRAPSPVRPSSPTKESSGSETLDEEDILPPRRQHLDVEKRSLIESGSEVRSQQLSLGSRQSWNLHSDPNAQSAAQPPDDDGLLAPPASPRRESLSQSASVVSQEQPHFSFVLDTRSPDKEAPKQADADEAETIEEDEEEEPSLKYELDEEDLGVTQDVLWPATQYTALPPPKRKPNPWKGMQEAFADADLPIAGPSKPKTASQSRLPFKPDSFTREQQAAAKAVSQVRRMSRQRTPEVQKPVSVPSSETPKKPGDPPVLAESSPTCLPSSQPVEIPPSAQVQRPMQRKVEEEEEEIEGSDDEGLEAARRALSVASSQPISDYSDGAAPPSQESFETWRILQGPKRPAEPGRPPMPKEVQEFWKKW